MRSTILFIPVALMLGQVADAQSTSGLLSQLGGGKGLGTGALGSLGGGAGSLLGGAGSSNITGLLGYCLKNQLLGAVGTGAGAGSTAGSAGTLLGKLTGRQGVTQSQGFLAGQQGVVQAGRTSLPLQSLGDGVKQQVCKSVLGRAQGLLGR